jgi:hypothetical protein
MRSIATLIKRSTRSELRRILVANDPQAVNAAPAAPSPYGFPENPWFRLQNSALVPRWAEFFGARHPPSRIRFILFEPKFRNACGFP